MRNFLIFFISLFFCSVVEAQDIPVQIEINRSTRNSVHFVCHNYTSTDYFVNLHFPILKGYHTKQALPYQLTVKSGKTPTLTLKRIKEYRNPTFRYTYAYIKGRVLTNVPSNYIYSLPIPQGDSVQVEELQSLDEFSNREAGENLYGLLFFMNKGDTVFACRDGVVAAVNDFEMKTERAKYRYRKSNNKIELFHSDGSFTRYSDVDVVLVEPGDMVSTGQAIAIVGGRIDEYKEHFRFLVYYLDEKKVNDLSSRTKYTLLTPIFRTGNKGELKLDNKQRYTNPFQVESLTKKNK